MAVEFTDPPVLVETVIRAPDFYPGTLGEAITFVEELRDNQLRTVRDGTRASAKVRGAKRDKDKPKGKSAREHAVTELIAADPPAGEVKDAEDVDTIRGLILLNIPVLLIEPNGAGVIYGAQDSRSAFLVRSSNTDRLVPYQTIADLLAQDKVQALAVTDARPGPVVQPATSGPPPPQEDVPVNVLDTSAPTQPVDEPITDLPESR